MIRLEKLPPNYYVEGPDDTPFSEALVRRPDIFEKINGHCPLWLKLTVEDAVVTGPPSIN